MRRMFVVAIALLAVMQLMAADIDVQSAQTKAQRFLTSRAGRVDFTSAPTVKWVHQEMNTSDASRAAYYIVNTDHGFVVVAGDDRAQEILAYGDGQLDMNSIPGNMKLWLDYYKAQMEYLQAHPGMAVEKSAQSANRGMMVEPMIEALWDQGNPYYNQCPVDGDRCSQTGCAATSLAQVFYYWKYPITPTPVVPGYTTRTKGFVLDALPSVTFDWENMLSTYSIFSNDASKAAVAQLMRYIGQAEQMDYTNEGSEAWEDDILRACHTFGYVNAQVVYKSILYDNGVDSVFIDDDTWNEMLQEELLAGRPVVFCAYSYSSAYNAYYGHAFNVDGFDADGYFHINWGWSGTGNGHFALNAFANQGYNYNIGQLMVMGIEPPAPIEAYDPVMQPANENYITLTSFRAEWTDETPAENVASYTLEVNAGDGSNHGVYEKVFSETFPYCTSSGSSAITKLDNYCSNKGWTGSYVYEANGGLRLGSSTKNGTLTTPALNMTQSGGKMTVVATMKPYSSDTNVPVRVTCGSSIVDVTVSANGNQTIILDCEADENQKVTFSTVEAGKRVVITQVDIYSATPDAAKGRDADSRIITDITDKFYTVTDLAEGGTFTYRVKACYVNGTQSAWSNSETVTLHESQQQHQPGDVDHDGSVSISDVSALIDLLLGNDSGDSCLTCADVDGDGEVAIADVSVLIDMLLNN